MRTKATELTQKEAADFLGIHVMTLRRWRRRYRMPVLGYTGTVPVFALRALRHAQAVHNKRMAKLAKRKGKS